MTLDLDSVVSFSKYEFSTPEQFPELNCGELIVSLSPEAPNYISLTQSKEDYSFNISYNSTLANYQNIGEHQVSLQVSPVSF